MPPLHGSGSGSGHSDRRGGASQVLAALGRLASLFYGAGARLHRRFGRRTRASRGQPSCAVISVGGLTVGGAGKTPVAAALALALAKRGTRVALASRGYRGNNPNAVSMVSDGQRIRSSGTVAGDESLLLAAHAPGVPVIVARDRRLAGHRAVSQFGTEVLVLDDGFQHHRLERDLDVVCVDAQSGFGNGRVLPSGPLREPMAALAQADGICLVGDADDFDVAAVLARCRPDPILIRAHRRPLGLDSLDRQSSRPLADLQGLSVGILAGIARPGSFRSTVEALGADVVSERLFRDHHRYKEKDLAGLATSAKTWVTTEKDGLKILPPWTRGVEILVLSIGVEFEEADSMLAAVERRLSHETA